MNFVVIVVKLLKAAIYYYLWSNRNSLDWHNFGWLPSKITLFLHFRQVADI